MKIIKIIVSIVISITSFAFPVSIILMILQKISIADIPCIYIICFTALWGLSLALLAILFCGDELGKCGILSKDFNTVINKIIPNPSEKNKKNQSENDKHEEPVSQNCISSKQLETLEKCFKSYSNAIADV